MSEQDQHAADINLPATLPDRKSSAGTGLIYGALGAGSVGSGMVVAATVAGKFVAPLAGFAKALAIGGLGFFVLAGVAGLAGIFYLWKSDNAKWKGQQLEAKIANKQLENKMEEIKALPAP